MGRIFQRGRLWWVAYHHRGVEHRESSGSLAEPDAIRLLKRRLGESALGQVSGWAAARVTLRQLLDLVEADYRVNRRATVKKTERQARYLDEFFPGARAIDLSTVRVHAYIAARQEKGSSNGEINRHLATLKRAYILGMQAQLITHRPYIPTLEEAAPRSGFFDDAAFVAVHRRLPSPIEDVAQFAYITGWRKREILRLEWERHVDWVAGGVRLDPGMTKTKAGRFFPFSIHPALCELIERRRALATAVEHAAMDRGVAMKIRWIFHRHGRPILDFRHAWERACAAADLGHRHFHDFRRTAVRNLVNAGVPEQVAQQLTGHKTRAVFDRYHIVSPEDLTQAVRQLAAAQKNIRTTPGQSQHGADHVK
jgi:integrase